MNNSQQNKITQEALINPNNDNWDNKNDKKNIKKDKNNMGINISRLFTKKDEHPYDNIEWKKQIASLTNEKGETIFEQKDVEFPSFWTQTAINVVSTKYFYGKLGAKDRENSLKTLIDRVSNTITDWGIKDKYFADKESAEAFRNELKFILVNQHAAFNSPVWFNCGIEEKPQCSACFINSLKDDMQSILDLVKTEGMLFKWGSGTGTNFSTLRSSKEPLSGGGYASGPVSFMKGFDSFAGVIKSGGKTRRAAKMVILDIDHPDIVEFINAKGNEEKKAWALIEEGYSAEFNVTGGAYDSIQFQNANNSVRVTDEFMETAAEDKDWYTKKVTNKEIMDKYKAKDILKSIAENAHICGDPGIQFDSTINRWHTCKNSGRISASNPCSEYMFLDDSACNLASINVLKYLDENDSFDITGFKHTVSIMTTAQEIIVDNASYPTNAITKNSKKFRPLGLGYANLGALLMSLGIAYDSNQGRAYAAAITALMTGQSYYQSSIIASKKGPFEAYAKNSNSMLEVIEMHKNEAEALDRKLMSSKMYEEICDVWSKALEYGNKYGFRNAQATVLAPTGTIGFMMDCDTTGVEPDLALIKYKKLVGEGYLKIVNNSVERALRTLKYEDDEIENIKKYIEQNDTIEGAPDLKEEHLAVFDCALKPANGKRLISYLGHVLMMASVQKFISGAISKTVNLPEDITADEIMSIYTIAWQEGLKAVAVYRDGSKRTQPLNIKKKEKEEIVQSKPARKKLPDERTSITHKFVIGGNKGYITVGMYEDGQPGEIFLTMAKEGSTVSGLMDAFATAVSMSLQYGVPLKDLINKFAHSRFEPAGFTNHPHIKMAKSILDYIFRWLAYKFLPKEEWKEVGLRADVSEIDFNGNLVKIKKDTNTKKKIQTSDKTDKTDDDDEEMRNKHNKKSNDVELNGNTIISDTPSLNEDGIPCPNCNGSFMIRAGSCYVCPQCGETSGCS